MAGWQDYLKLLVSLTHTLEELTKVEGRRTTPPPGGLGRGGGLYEAGAGAQPVHAGL